MTANWYHLTLSAPLLYSIKRYDLEECPMSAPRGNPFGLDGFAFIEFTSPDPAAMGAQLEQLGFVAAARQRSRGLTLYRQGWIDFVLNEGRTGQAAAFARLHGPSANGM